MPALKRLPKTSAEAARNQSNRTLIRRLLAWYDVNQRRLPWRALPGKTQSPYRVWLSEIMLQQTTVPTVIPYYLKFMKRWPDFQALAAAPVEDVMSAWAGLGYYSRARNLHACAKVVAEKFAGRMPSDEVALKSLPGIGPYTAAAIASIAFGKQAAPVDGNIERVLSRLRCVTEPFPRSKPLLKSLAEELAPPKRSGDFAQAMMDLGSDICTPKSPSCTKCPWESACEAKAKGIAENIPARQPRRPRPLKRAAAFVLITAANEVFLRRRPTKGLLAGMHETPTSPFEMNFPADPVSFAPVKASYLKLDERVLHTFTHFDLELDVYVADIEQRQAQTLDGEWAPLSRLEEFALPSLFLKVVRTAQRAKPGPRTRSVIKRK
ncbi:MAG: A/G-specific adenine glycosylase [Micropepsaceae bacterium]